jgi:hypothetical protein
MERVGYRHWLGLRLSGIAFRPEVVLGLPASIARTAVAVLTSPLTARAGANGATSGRGPVST